MNDNELEVEREMFSLYERKYPICYLFTDICMVLRVFIMQGIIISKSIHKWVIVVSELT